MARRKYLTNAELQAVIENWSEDDEDGHEKASAIENVTCLPPDNTAGDSDCETENDNDISANLNTDVNPLAEIAGNIFPIVSVVLADNLCFICKIEVVCASNVEDYAGPEEVVESKEPLPSTSAQLPKQTYRPATDFKPKWARTKRVSYDKKYLFDVRQIHNATIYGHSAVFGISQCTTNQIILENRSSIWHSVDSKLDGAEHFHEIKSDLSYR